MAGVADRRAERVVPAGTGESRARINLSLVTPVYGAETPRTDQRTGSEPA